MDEKKKINREGLENFFHKFFDRDNLTLNRDNTKLNLLQKQIL